MNQRENDWCHPFATAVEDLPTKGSLTVGTLDEVQVYCTDDSLKVATFTESAPPQPISDETEARQVPLPMGWPR
jgi:hypothetical protein